LRVTRQAPLLPAHRSTQGGFSARRAALITAWASASYTADSRSVFQTVLPAPGQGALAVECAADNASLAAALAELDDPYTRAAVTAERSLLAALEAGCSAPVGALADLLADGQIVKEMRLRGVVGTTDGSTLVHLSTTGPVPETDDQAVALGRELATEMLAKGAAGLMGERAL
jgi:hydroxymethylbilane synthase